MNRPPRPLPHVRPSLRPLTGRRGLTGAGPAAEVARAELLDAAVDWGRYVDGQRAPGRDFSAAVEAAHAGEGFIWLGLHEPTTAQLDRLGDVFPLHPLALEDAATVRQRPKIERYEDSLFLVLRTLAYVEHDVHEDVGGGDIVETGAVMVFLGDWFVVTIRHGRHASMSRLRKDLEEDDQLLALGPSAVLHAVCDKVVDDYLLVVDAVQEDIEEIEATVFAPRTGADVERIYQLKRDIIEMKRSVTPLATPLHDLAERPRRLVHTDIREYFRDVEDHLTRVHEQVQSFDELLSSILQAGLARLSVSENEDMRKISAWVAIAAVPTLLAGIYGMNFQYMPELGWHWGYPALLALMALICGGLYRGFRRNGWL